MKADDITEAVTDAIPGHPRIYSVYLFGSQVEGRTRPASDVDLAVLFSAETNPGERLEESLDLRAKLEAALGQSVDIVPLNDAHPSLAFRALRGRLLVDRDPVARSLHAARTISRYHEYRRYLEKHVPAMELRAREGRFGTAR